LNHTCQLLLIYNEVEA